MRSSWTIGRAVAAALALVLVIAGVRFLLDGNRRNRDFVLWQTAKPVDSAIDFSMPGRFVLPFEQTCSSSHGEILALRFPAEVLQSKSVAQLLSGLNATLDIKTNSGSNVVEGATSQISSDDETIDGAIPIFNIAPFRKGAYSATVTVIEGAPALKGVAHRLEGRYLLCGLEQLPATIANILGAASLVIGSAVGILVCVRVAREQRKHEN